MTREKMKNKKETGKKKKKNAARRQEKYATIRQERDTTMKQEKCWQWVKCYTPIIIVRDQYKVLCLGLSGAGKSTVLATLVGETIKDIEPTTGFNIKTLPLKDTVVDIKELGGGENVRPFWNRYFEGQHGILFVIDASCDEEEFKEAFDDLQEVLSESSLKGVPCCILATHQDIEGSRTQQQIEQHFRKLLCNRRWRVQVCGLEDRTSIVQGLESLVDLMTGVE